MAKTRSDITLWRSGNLPTYETVRTSAEAANTSTKRRPDNLSLPLTHSLMLMWVSVSMSKCSLSDAVRCIGKRTIEDPEGLCSLKLWLPQKQKTPTCDNIGITTPRHEIQQSNDCSADTETNIFTSNRSGMYYRKFPKRFSSPSASCISFSPHDLSIQKRERTKNSRPWY